MQALSAALKEKKQLGQLRVIRRIKVEFGYGAVTVGCSLAEKRGPSPVPAPKRASPRCFSLVRYV